jgi:subtilase family serine protease
VLTTRNRRYRAISAVAAASLAIGLAAVARPAQAAPARHAIPNSSPNWLRQARALGRTASSSRVNFGLVLSLRNSTQAVAQLQAVSNPDSASYAKYLSNAQFNATYAPSKASVIAVERWLAGKGFGLGTALPSGLYISASGTAAQIEKVFGTSMSNYQIQGKTVQTNTTQLSFPSDTPAAVLSVVKGVVGVDQAGALKAPADAAPPPSDGFRAGTPCSSYYGQKAATGVPKAYGQNHTYVVCGYGPQQYQSAYGESALLSHGVTGKGVTVAITDAYASPTILSDANKYSRVHSQPQFTGGQFKQITPGKNGFANYDICGDWYGEETLDVEAVHAMAPGAKVVYLGAADCLSSLDETWAAAIDNHVADIITNSWGNDIDTVDAFGQEYIDFYTEFSIEAALTGITVNFSSGDDGDQTAGGTNLADKTADFPADLPYVTGIGGTSVEIGSKGQWLGEYGWQNGYSSLTDGAWSPNPPGDYSSGGGGGPSQIFTQPFYQRGKVPASMANYYGKTAMRVVPDISMPGDPNTGMLVGQTQVFPDGTYWDQYRIGGTSLASPLMAGVLAVSEQYAHRKFGFVNPLYYKLLGTPALHDIVAPKHPVAEVRTNFNNSVDGSDGKSYILRTTDVQTSTLHSVRGYDDETGVGTPNGPLFFVGMALLARFS